MKLHGHWTNLYTWELFVLCSSVRMTGKNNLLILHIWKIFVLCSSIRETDSFVSYSLPHLYCYAACQQTCVVVKLLTRFHKNYRIQWCLCMVFKMCYFYHVHAIDFFMFWYKIELFTCRYYLQHVLNIDILFINSANNWILCFPLCSQYVLGTNYQCLIMTLYI